MDICSHIGFPVNDINSLHGFTLESTYGLVGDFSVDELAYGVTTFLNIQDDVEVVLGSIPPHEKRVFQSKIITIEAHENEDACLITSEILTHDGNAKYINPYCSSAPSLPILLKPASAMKGSREKRGASPPNKLTVKWAPDVYDPIPTSTLQMVINRPHHKHGKKKSKSKQKTESKSTSSRGSKGKDKKQVRKGSGSEHNSCFRDPDPDPAKCY